MSSKITFVLVKPEGIFQIQWIRRMLADVARVEYDGTVFLTPAMLEQLYPQLSPLIKQEMLDQYEETHHAPRLLVLSRCTAEDVAMIIGTESDPECCVNTSVRHQLWSIKPMIPKLLTDDHTEFRYNYVYYPPSDERVVSELKALLNGHHVELFKKLGLEE